MNLGGGPGPEREFWTAGQPIWRAPTPPAARLRRRSTEFSPSGVWFRRFGRLKVGFFEPSADGVDAQVA